jgi:UDP-N-acetylglucosamine--N-acetylmuramyl-(pentapeptide) pyrophosphoryl-undecaprenol N-acetylglucosamine transferase
MRLLVTGGGTGGHIYPALAIVDAVRRHAPQARVLYIGGSRGMEEELAAKAGVDFMPVDVTGLVRKAPRQVLAGLARAARAVVRSRQIIRQFNPEVAVGTGGYVSGPVLCAAYLEGVPVVLQEQNAIPGVTNRYLARWAQLVCAPFEGAASRFPRGTPVVVTGNPVREELATLGRDEALRVLGLPGGRPVLLSTGGSQGASSIVKATVSLIAGGRLPPGTVVLFATGSRYYDAAVSGLKAAGIDPGASGDVILRHYWHDLHLAMVAADLALCRAGAMTVSELAACGLPAVLVPSPHVAHNEQEHNARVLVEAGAGVLVTEGGDVTKQVERAVVDLLHAPGRLSGMRERCQSLGRPGAADHIAHLLAEVARKP